MGLLTGWGLGAALLMSRPHQLYGHPTRHRAGMAVRGARGVRSLGRMAPEPLPAQPLPKAGGPMVGTLAGATVKVSDGVKDQAHQGFILWISAWLPVNYGRSLCCRHLMLGCQGEPKPAGGWLAALADPAFAGRSTLDTFRPPGFGEGVDHSWMPTT